MGFQPSFSYSLSTRRKTLRGDRSMPWPSKVKQSWMICAVGSLAQGTGRSVVASGRKSMSGSATEVKSFSG